MVNNTNVYSKEQYLTTLNNLCWICRESFFRRNCRGKLCQEYKQSIEEFYITSVNKETDNVLYSNILCSKCYQKLPLLRKKNIPQKEVLVTVGDTGKNDVIQFDSFLTLLSCAVCKK